MVAPIGARRSNGSPTSSTRRTGVVRKDPPSAEGRPSERRRRGGDLSAEKDKLRELFIDELEEVQGGAPAAAGPLTTMACCEEIIGPCCDILPWE